MRIRAEKIENESQLLTDYKRNREIVDFFDYSLSEPLSDRVNELEKRQFKRRELAEVLEGCNKKWGAGEKTFENIKRLEKPDALTVVGGQQAGLLTGPLYTINKAISMIQFAREQEKLLGIPVLPVFWIAGEDHDFDEINHIFLPSKKQLVKCRLKQPSYKKIPISSMEYNKELLKDWLDGSFSLLPETEHTKDLFAIVEKTMLNAESFTDFFASLLHTLFPDSGLILLDSADPRIRRIESEYFIQLIENQEKISEGVFEASEQLLAKGYSSSFEPELQDGHLFYHLNGERVLLKRTETGAWVGKNGEGEWSTEDLLETAKVNPENLSNNVMTRPLMQEFLLPTLAFIAGPGEISYWALLKPAFCALELKMPPVIPRLSFTFIFEEAKKALEQTGISVATAVNKGSKEEKEKWLLNKQDPPIDSVADELKKTIEEAHIPIQQLASNIRADMAGLAEKNLSYLHREIDYLRNRLKLALEEKFEKDLEQFELIEMVFHPEGGLQERTWNILPMVNEYGVGFLERLAESSCSFQDQHYIVYL